MLSRRVNTMLLVAALCAGITLTAVAASTSRLVRFAKGSSAAILKGSIKGYDHVDYRLRGGAGQALSVSMTANHASAHFNVLPPGSTDEAIYNSAVDGNTWRGRLQLAGDYTIRVYLYRNEARRGTTASYTLKVGITGSSGSLDAKVPGTPFHATGELPCTMGSAAETMCTFGVIRGQAGHAEVRIAPPGGTARTLIFDPRRVTAPSSRSVETIKTGDEWTIEVNGFERYRVPEAVVNGG